ncbi:MULTISPECIES: helix-turn-helix domain-containing protein [Catenuloplanes]|uniref:AraC-like DNA-binding protein n=1 Tax=Catenuloplanes niger TaxID=587534 RepID=A0AAE3ZK41_9ACTN|nr:helix-turn-helix domain-containing protein [Catenuloplanes niger]MDR7320124.1 AraC-like DNA-binding protein [Catenuloplanes niger]
MAYVLDTVDLPPGERAEAVRTAMMYASAPCHVIHEEPDGPVHARMEVWDLGDANVFTHRSSGIRLLRTDRLARQDAMPVVALSVQLRADGRIAQAGRQAVVPAGELLAVDLSAAYDYSWSGHGAAGAIQVPFDRLGLPVDLVRRAVPEIRSSPYHRMLIDHVGHLARDPARLTGNAAVATASVELVRALLATAVPPGRDTRRVLAETLLTRVLAFARAHLADPDLSPAAIASAHHVSLRHLYQVCAEANLSLEQWIIGERLRHARQDLLRPENRHRPVAAIAHRWGFRDPTHFTRRFKARYGVLPSRLRRSSETDRG